MPTRFFHFHKAVVGYCTLTFALFVVKITGLHNYFLLFQGNPVVAESCRRKTRNGCTAIGTAVNKLSWKAGALTIVLHLRSPSVEIVSLVILTCFSSNVNPPAAIFFLSHPSRHSARNARSSSSPSGPSSRSGCHCTPQTGSVSWHSASTTPSPLHCTARKPCPRRSTA